MCVQQFELNTLNWRTYQQRLFWSHLWLHSPGKLCALWHFDHPTLFGHLLWMLVSDILQKFAIVHCSNPELIYYFLWSKAVDICKMKLMYKNYPFKSFNYFFYLLVWIIFSPGLAVNMFNWDWFWPGSAGPISTLWNKRSPSCLKFIHKIIKLETKTHVFWNICRSDEQ